MLYDYDEKVYIAPCLSIDCLKYENSKSAKGMNKKLKIFRCGENVGKENRKPS